jgi:hypothetical protein
MRKQPLFKSKSTGFINSVSVGCLVYIYVLAHWPHLPLLILISNLALPKR